MTLPEKYAAAQQEYLLRLKFQNLTPATARNYETTLNLFGAYLEREQPEDVFEAVEGWKESLLLSGRQPSTVNQHLTRLKAFFTKAGKRGFPKALRFEENPIDEDLKVKEVKRPYEEILTDEQVIRLFENRPPKGVDTLWPRNYAMLMLLVNEKIRNAELLDLRLSDVDLRHHELTVRSGKGRKFRVVDLTPLSETAVALYILSGLRPLALSDEDYLFGTEAPHEKGNSGGKIKWHRGTTQWVSEIVRRSVLAITGVDQVRSHDLRHVGSRVCLNAGMSIEQLQGQLGHSSIVTTQIYTSRVMQRRRRESAQAVLEAREQTAKKNEAKIALLLRHQNRTAEQKRA